VQPLPSNRRVEPVSSLPARDIAEMRVAEQLAADGCPLCGSRASAERRFVDAVIGEAVNDVGVRRRLEASGGYCARHVALLPVRERARRGGTLGSAILLGAVLRARLDALDAAVSGGGRRLGGRVAALRGPEACPLCADVEGSVASTMTVLVGRLGDPAWSVALARSELCLDDLLLLWAATAAAGGRTLDAWRPIGEAQAARLRTMLATADGYIAHSAHDRQSELTDAERLAADALVRALAGEPDAR
jgi:hypothetical protein